MNIGINLLPLRPTKNGGMEVYFRNLLASLLMLDDKNEYSLITAPHNDSSIQCPASNCRKILLPGKSTIFYRIGHSLNRAIRHPRASQGSLSYIIDKYRFNLWFCPFLSLDPRPLAIPSIVTIPDIQHEYYPEFFSNHELSLRKGYIQPSCEAATDIITISKHSKQCLIDKFNVDSNKIHVIYLAASDMYHNSRIETDSARHKYQLPQEYLFYPANCWPHKNHLILIMAFYLYHKTFNNHLHLVFSGSGINDNPSIKDLITQYHLQEYVHILDYIDSDDMPGLYKNAQALVFPSLFEGFGIPLLEAMAMGCPIIASDSTSVPEVAGDAAYLFDPKNPQSICEAIHRIVADGALRETLISRGKNRATQYSYEKVARMHLDLFLAAREKADNAKIAYRNQEKVVLDGHYQDGWISSRMEFKYKGPKLFRSVRMDLVGGLPVRYPMNITIILNKRKKYRIQIPAVGKYSFEGEFPECADNEFACTIEVIPGKSYVPRKLGINNDDRSISVMLDALTLIDNTSTTTEFIKKTI